MSLYNDAYTYAEAITQLNRMVAKGTVLWQDWYEYHEWEQDEREWKDITTYEIPVSKDNGVYYVGSAVLDPKDKDFIGALFELLEFHIRC